MPVETFHGSDVPSVFVRARAALGADAVVLSVRRIDGPRRGFELIAADPASADAVQRGRASGLDGGARWVAGAQEVTSGGPAIIALVGPTGAGKTTTIAKLANHPRVFGSLRVGLLTLDTYRVGAVEQLAIYAELSRVPLEVVYDVSELVGALRRLGGCDIILVDTAGRGPSAHADLAATWATLRRLEAFEVHLTLPAGLQPELARRVIAQHRSLGVTHLLATKLDEYPEDTTIFDLAVDYRMPMVWITDGQEVPADLKPAAPRLAMSACAWGRSGALAEVAV